MDCADLIFFREGILNFIEGVFMKKVILTAAAALTLGAASFAMAGGLDQTGPSQAKHGGLYVGGGLGYASTTLPKKIFTDDNTLTSLFQAVNQANKFDNFAATVHMGYLFSVTQNFLLGAEFGYTYLPENKYTFDLQTLANPSIKPDVTGTIKYNTQYSLDLLGVAKYYVTNEFNVFGKAGISYVNQEVIQSFAGQVSPGILTKKLTKKKGKVLPKLAVGIGYDIAPNVELTAEYSHTFGDKIHQVGKGSQIVDSKFVNEQLLVDASKIPSNNEVLVGVNYYFNM